MTAKTRFPIQPADTVFRSGVISSGSAQNGQRNRIRDMTSFPVFCSFSRFANSAARPPIRSLARSLLMYFLFAPIAAIFLPDVQVQRTQPDR